MGRDIIKPEAKCYSHTEHWTHTKELTLTIKRKRRQGLEPTQETCN